MVVVDLNVGSMRATCQDIVFYDTPLKTRLTIMAKNNDYTRSSSCDIVVNEWSSVWPNTCGRERERGG